MLETKLTITRGTFARLTRDGVPSISFYKISRRLDGGQKYISSSVPVHDDELLARIEQEIEEGDEIEVTIETHWSEKGIPKSLLDFRLVSPRQREAGIVTDILAYTDAPMYEAGSVKRKPR